MVKAPTSFRLAKDCDVLVENYLPDTLKKYQLDFQSINRINPRLIYASITGYGQTGPYRKRAGYDVMVEAEMGLMHITGSRDGPPVKVGVAVTDLTTGLYTSNSIMAALLARARTGKGQHIDVALSDCQVATLANIASSALISGQPDSGRWGTSHPSIVPYRSFKTRDGDILLGGGNDRLFGVLCDKLEKPEWKSDERFSMNSVRVANRVTLEAMIEAETRTRTTEEWLQLLNESGMPYAAVNDIQATLNHEHVLARDMVKEVEHPTCGPMKLVNTPVKYSHSEPSIRTAPPTLGQHTDEILSGILGMSDADISGLRETVARIIQEGACKASNPLIQNPPTADVTVYGTPVTSQLPDPVQQRAVQQPAPAPVYVTPGYVAPPSKSVRGVRRGTTRGRGGRKPKIKVEAPDNGDTFTITSTPTGGRGSGRGRGRGGRVNRGGRPRGSRAGASSARGGKRKREDDDEKDDSDVSEIITVLPTQSRSGRKIIHANNFSPVVIDLEKEPPSSKTAATAKPASNAPIQPVKGKGGKRFSRPGEASVCKNCSRGHSPASNMIVFCDGCNGPWHQYCHDPPISSEVVRIEEQEWFCADCMVLREEKAHVDGKVSAETLSVVEKRRYLQSLPPAQLVSLLLHATVLHPDLPIFATPFGGPLPERPKRPITHFVDPTAPPEEEDESYDLYPDSEVLPYPKAGNGVPLPRESDFLSLLIDEDVGVYSHAWNWKQRGLDCDGNVEGGRINGTAIAA
ncbi:MAG: hypothetical protein LQ338_006559 [Usnochroma carphineum]|nr:MAG: hypothetical protein LQ338_006559 [Usnochroma carphineum]